MRGLAAWQDDTRALHTCPSVADEDVDREHTLQERGPGEPTEWACVAITRTLSGIRTSDG